MSVSLRELTEMVADLAEEVATGAAGHTRPASLNKSMAVWKALRPDASVSEDPEPGDNCGKPRVKGDEDSEICLRAKGHDGGHAFGPAPKQAVDSVQAP
jgi:hypothetical protein